MKISRVSHSWGVLSRSTRTPPYLSMTYPSFMWFFSQKTTRNTIIPKKIILVTKNVSQNLMKNVPQMPMKRTKCRFLNQFQCEMRLCFVLFRFQFPFVPVSSRGNEIHSNYYGLWWLSPHRMRMIHVSLSRVESRLPYTCMYSSVYAHVRLYVGFFMLLLPLILLLLLVVLMLLLERRGWKFSIHTSAPNL